MKIKLSRILLLTIAIIFIVNIKSTYSVESKDIDRQIANWTAGGTSGFTKEQNLEQHKQILLNLQNDFQYKGTTINNEMKMKTTISIIEKYDKQILLGLLGTEKRYKIRIRNRYK